MIHANQMEQLRHLMVRIIKTSPLSPLENESVLVQSNGMAQWLKLALASEEGCRISAAVQFILPARFLWQVYRSACADTEIPRTSPYDKQRLQWRLIRLLAHLPETPCFAPLQRFLANDQDLRKRGQLAEQLAGLYDQYQVYRADWLADWAQGARQLRNPAGQVQALPEASHWQAALWQLLHVDIGTRQRFSSRSDIHQHFLQTISRLTTPPPGLPRRVMVFGISSLPRQTLEVLQSLSHFIHILVYVHNPCRYYWADIVEGRELLRATRRRRPLKNPQAALQVSSVQSPETNPLLAAWGKQGRDYISLLDELEQTSRAPQPSAAIDLFTDVIPEDPPGPLLAQVQQAILDLNPLPEADRSSTEAEACKLPVARDDSSIVFQVAHSPQREVEILQDHLLALWAAHPDVTPRDIIVMTPDIDAYTPHIEAVFGALEPRDPRYIPFTMADHAGRSTSLLLPALEILLQLPDLRFSAGEILGLLEIPALQQRFGLVETDLDHLRQWVEGTGVRWGLNANHRQRFDLPAGLAHNTWNSGLQRLLLGYAVGEGQTWQGIEPYPNIGGLDAALAGPLFQFLKTIEKHCQIIETTASVATWVQRLIDLQADFFEPLSSPDLLFRHRLEAVLLEWQDACQEAGLVEPLPLTVVRNAILKPLQEGNISQRFLVGKVNFGTFMPMRAIPFRIVCLLGMNDGAYPRSHHPVDFDLMNAPGQYRPGDRSHREDDRYLFLEALLSARDQLYISYIGRSVLDNSIRQPSVLVAQLQDYLAQGWRLADIHPNGVAAADGGPHLIRQHPLQPFSRRYFSDHRAGPQTRQLFTYSDQWRKSLNMPVQALADPLAPATIEGPRQLPALMRFLKNPTQYFFNQRLNVYFDRLNETSLDLECFKLDNFSATSFGRQLLDEALAKEPERRRATVQQGILRLQRASALPPGSLGELAAASLSERLEPILEQVTALEQDWPELLTPREIQRVLTLNGSEALRLEDWLDDIHCASGSDSTPKRPCVRWECDPQEISSQKKYAALIPLWVKHLAGCSLQLHLTSYLIASDGPIALPPLAPELAAQHLDHLMQQACVGFQKPLAVTARTALSWSHTRRGKDKSEDKARKAARKAFEGNGFTSGELDYCPYLKRTWPDFDTLWQADNNHFRELATSLYEPLIEQIAN